MSSTRTYEEVQQQRIDAFVNTIEEIKSYEDKPSFCEIIAANHWLVNKCIDLVFEKMDIHTTMDVLEKLKELHPKWFEEVK